MELDDGLVHVMENLSHAIDWTSSVPLVALKSSYSSFVVSCLNVGVTKPTPSAMLR